jgi:hypothetical protein
MLLPFTKRFSHYGRGRRSEWPTPCPSQLCYHPNCFCPFVVTKFDNTQIHNRWFNKGLFRLHGSSLCWVSTIGRLAHMDQKDRTTIIVESARLSVHLKNGSSICPFLLWRKSLRFKFEYRIRRSRSLLSNEGLRL